MKFQNKSVQKITATTGPSSGVKYGKEKRQYWGWHEWLMIVLSVIIITSAATFKITAKKRVEYRIEKLTRERDSLIHLRDSMNEVDRFERNRLNRLPDDEDPIIRRLNNSNETR